MSLLIWSKGFSYSGKVKDLPKLFREFPEYLTLQELINLKLH